MLGNELASSKSEQEAREQHILDATAALIMRQGYDKTTMSDVADEVGVSRGIVYLHFDSKEKLFEALIQREVLQYAQTWLEHIEADPRGGTIGGIYRAVLYAINSRPLMAAMMKRDRRVVGSYLRKPGNMFSSMQSSSMNIDFLQALQAAGAVRQDVDPLLMSHIMDILSYGLITVGDFRQPEELPPYETVMETIADMLDRLLTPDDGGNSEAGKAVIRQLAAAARTQFEQMKPSSEK
jgi:TetR/AcrR family acrAB operon transcriptional repressor